MTLRQALSTGLLLAALAVAGAAAFATREHWQPLLEKTLATPETASPAEAEHGHDHAHDLGDHLDLTPQAQKSIGLRVEPLELGEYTRTVRIPGVIVPRPGQGEVGVSTLMEGVVSSVHALPGETVRPGQELFRVHLHDEDVTGWQAELFKNTRNLAINEAERGRLAGLARMGAVAESRMLDLGYEQQRLQAGVQALRASMAIHGFTPEQLDAIAAGKFVYEVTVRAPAADERQVAANGVRPTGGEAVSADAGPVYQVKELKVKVGDQVQAGQLLATLNNHQVLYLEGRVFPREVPLVENAIRDQTAVHAEVLDVAGQTWSAVRQPLHVLYMDQSAAADSQTVAVYVPLENQYEEHARDGKTYRLWQYRPGQRVYLRVPVERLTDVFVLPRGAVVKDGAEAFVFRQNGEVFQLRPVHVVHEDSSAVVLANDGSVHPGSRVVRNAAAQLYRALKTKGEGGGHDHHHGHSH